MTITFFAAPNASGHVEGCEQGDYHLLCSHECIRPRRGLRTGCSWPFFAARDAGWNAVGWKRDGGECGRPKEDGRGRGFQAVEPAGLEPAAHLPSADPSGSGPPQTEFTMGPGGAQAEEVAQESCPDDLDQTPHFDPAEPEPIPDDLDQSTQFDPTDPEPIPEEGFDQRCGA